MGLTLSLLGEIEISLNGNSLQDLPSQKAQALLFYLAVESQRAHLREALAEMFWPEKPPGFGRNNLKQVLSQLKKVLGDQRAVEPFLITSKRDLQFNTGSQFRIDVLKLEELHRRTRTHHHDVLVNCESCLESLLAAHTLYRDEFLRDFYLPDSPEFNEWVITKREYFRRLAVDTLNQLISCQEQRGEFRKAVIYGEDLVKLEPWSEAAHRKLMTLLAASGKRGAALKQFQICKRMLKDEFDVQPVSETTDLYEKIKNWKTPEGSEEILIIPSGASAAIPAEEAMSPKSTPQLRFWVIGSAVISLLVLIGFIVQAWNGRKDPFTSPPDDHSLTQNLSDEDEIQAAAPIAPEVEAYLEGENPHQALAAIYNNTQGSNWFQNQGWMENSTPCEWFGITCQGDTIVELRLPDNNLEGILPPELGDFPSLRVLDLSNNMLKGSIPPEIGNLSELKILYLEGNFELSGKIPPEIGNLHRLEELILSSASEGGSLLSGTLPVELGELIKIDRIIIEDTLIQGSILPQLGNLLTLSELSLAHNNLSGSIPEELFNLTKLRSLDLWANQTLTGELSPKIGQLKNLDFLNLSHNNFSGTLPEELGTLPHLNWIGLSDNQFEGSLPASLILLDPIVLNFANSNLCVPVDPDFQAWLERINNLSSTGKICGQISTDQHDRTDTPMAIDPQMISSEQACLPSERLLYFEDFQDGRAQGLPEIEFKAQNWDIVPDPDDPENLMAQNPGLNPAMAINQDYLFQDAVMRVDFLPTGRSQPIFLWLANQTPYQEERGLVTHSDYSIGFMDYGQHFERYTSPLPATALQEDHYWLVFNSWHRVEIATYQGMLSVWLDGVELLTYQDPKPLPPGTLGIGLGESLEEGSLVYFDNLTVCELSEPFRSIYSQ